ncbi:hypothetical protein [Vallicoccus soli]|uniref:hypothetical protein n=1 Tax=Vallicoccus soli TaxID=2339232 RepID=UPI001402CAAA|nr:hypothetical protein [Vallicoccus soli]
MYGAKTTLGGTSASVAGVSLPAAQDVWWVFAAITVLFAVSAAWQLVRRPARHLP